MSKLPLSSLSTLTLDDATRVSRAARYFRNVRIPLLVAFTATLIGIVSYVTLPRELNPNIKIAIVTVITTLPGADPSDVESLVTIPIEDSLKGLSGLDKMTSTSNQGVSAITLQFLSTVDPDKAQADAKSAVDRVNTLPGTVVAPVVSKIDFQNQPILQFAITAGGGNRESLPALTDRVKQQLKEIDGVKDITVSGDEAPEVEIVIHPEALADKNISLPTFVNDLDEALTKLPAGTVSVHDLTFTVSIDPHATSVETLRTLRIPIGTSVEPLADFADIHERPLPDTAIVSVTTPSHEAVPAAFFLVYKTDSARIDTVGAAIKSKLAQLAKTDHFETDISFDSTTDIEREFGRLFHDFSITIGLVVLILFLFFGLRQSLIAAFAIPFTFLTTFAVMQAVGLSLTFIALFSLLLSLGVLVDNAIVITAAYTSYFRTGRFTPYETALLVWRDFRDVIFATTLTTVWAFVPLLLATGIIGEFIKSIPIVVSTTLIISALAALFLILPILVVLFEGNFPRRVRIFFRVVGIIAALAATAFLVPAGQGFSLAFLDALLWIGAIVSGIALIRRSWPAFSAAHPKTETFWKNIARYSHDGVLSFDRVAERYQAFLLFLFDNLTARRKMFIIILGIALFSYLLFPLGFVVNEFFPKTDQDILFIGITMPEGTTITETEAASASALDLVRGLPYLDSAVGEVGVGVPEGGAQISSGTNHILITLHLTPAADRPQSTTDLTPILTERMRPFTSGEFSVVQLSGGPPAGSDLQIGIRGDDFTELGSLAEKLSDYLSTRSGVTDIKITPENGPGKLVFTPDQAKLAEYHLTPSTLSLYLRAATEGGITIKDNILLDGGNRDGNTIFLRFSSSREPDVATVGNILIPTGIVGNVPFSSLGTLRLEPSPSLITRDSGKRVVTVSASVAAGTSVSIENSKLLDAANRLTKSEDTSFIVGGVNDENQKSVQSILLAMILSTFLIFGTMVIQLGSFRKAVIVLLVIPLAVSGVFLIFALTQTPLSFPALIGVLALFGIVVNNSIILVDKINKNLDHGMAVREAVADGAASRLEPILLTAITTIVGLIPITLSDPLWRGLGGAIISGLLLSGLMKLFFIPIVYRAWFSEPVLDTEKQDNV